MDQYNTARPLVMHIDLNSCFATIEQQSRPMLRGRPVAVLNRRSEHTSIVTCSYEAKARGVAMLMSWREAKRICPELVGIESDPAKYKHVYRELVRIMRDYSPKFVMKSIDEGVIDFGQTTADIAGRDLTVVGQEIKQRLRDEVGEAMRCNIGLGTNRFLAKTAASLNKPDGLDVITHQNLRQVYAGLELEDLTGIARRNRARLEQVGIMTPLEFLGADEETLRQMVFRSINGTQWYQRLRGWEVDDVEYGMKTCGRQYVLESRDLTRQQVAERLHHLVEEVGWKLRSQGKCARGVGVYARLYGTGEGLHESNGRWGCKGSYYHQKFLTPLPFFSDKAIWAIARGLLAQCPPGQIREIGVHCYHLHDDAGDQLSLFGDQLAREKQQTSAVDEINDRYGRRTIHSADTLLTNDYMRAKIPFGSTRYL